MDANSVEENCATTTTTPSLHPDAEPASSDKASASTDAPSTSETALNVSTTQVGHNIDPEKRKSPSKRRSIVKPKRKPQAQGYYRRRLEFFDQKQNGTKDDVAAFSDLATKGLQMIPEVLEGNLHPQQLFPLYNQAVNTYLEASVKLRQTILTERKLAAEVWGDNSIASYSNGIYTVQKDCIEELLKPKADDVKIKIEPQKKVAKKRKQSSPIPNATHGHHVEVTAVINPELQEMYEFIEFTHNMSITRSQTKSTREPFEVKLETPPPPPPSIAPVSSVKGKRKKPLQVTSSQEAKKARVSKDSPAVTPPPDAALPPPPPPPPFPRRINKKVVETPMPAFKIIEENMVSRKAVGIIKDGSVLVCYCKPDENTGKGCYDDCVNRMLHMECGSRCRVGKQCQNKRFQNFQYSSFEPFFSGEKGWGIRATQKIEKGRFIVEYVGEVVDHDEMVKRQKKYTKNNHKHHYMMSLRNGAVIDATVYGNYSRFVNHSCDPNAETQKWVVDKEIRIGFFSKKDIACGEEIVFDYAFERFGKDAQECYCGSDNCTGFIGSKPQECDNDEDEVDDEEESTSDNSLEDDKAAKKPIKPKLSAEEKEFRKKMAKARRKLNKCRREVRKIIGRKRNFTAEDVLEFNRQIIAVDGYTQRILLSDYLISVTDDQWKTWFIQKRGMSVIWTWLNMATLDILKIVRLRYNLLKFLQTLPVEFAEQVKESKILNVIQSMMDTKLPDSVVIPETLNDLVGIVAEEPPIPDKQLARMLNRDGISTIKLYDESLEICNDLYEKWTKLPHSIHDGLVDISDEELQENDQSPSEIITIDDDNFDEINDAITKEENADKTKDGIAAQDVEMNANIIPNAGTDNKSTSSNDMVSNTNSYRPKFRPNFPYNANFSAARRRYNNHHYEDYRSRRHFEYNNSRLHFEYNNSRHHFEDNRSRHHYEDSRSRHHFEDNRSRSRYENRSRYSSRFSPIRSTHSRASPIRSSHSNQLRISPVRTSHTSQMHKERDGSKSKSYDKSPVEIHEEREGSKTKTYDKTQLGFHPPQPPSKQPFSIFEKTYQATLTAMEIKQEQQKSPVISDPVQNPSNYDNCHTKEKDVSASSTDEMNPFTLLRPPQFTIKASFPMFERMIQSTLPAKEIKKEKEDSPIVSDPVQHQPVKEIKEEELSPAVSDPIQNQSDNEECQKQETVVSKCKTYEKNPDWIETFTDDGIIYYYHRETRETTWDEPRPKELEALPIQAVKVEPSSVLHSHENAVVQKHEHSSDVPQSDSDVSLKKILDEKKKEFKLVVWQNIFKYLTNKEDLRRMGISHNILTQFARKITHKVLDSEIRNGNNALNVNDQVFVKARELTDHNYQHFLSEVRPIKAEPAH